LIVDILYWTGIIIIKTIEIIIDITISIIYWDQYRFGAQKIDQKYPVTLVKFSVHFQIRSMRLCAR